MSSIFLGFKAARGSPHSSIHIIHLPRTSGNPTRQDMSKILMQGRRKRPNAMVTHTWHSRFRDLVASVVVEALQAAVEPNGERFGQRKPQGDGWDRTSPKCWIFMVILT